MLYGLSLLAFNLERFMEIIFVYLFLFWEKNSMRQMIFKNLTAHKMRNKMTSIIFSISIGFIIFLVVMYKLQITSQQLIKLRNSGAYFRVENRGAFALNPETFDPIIERNIKNIESFAYCTTPLHEDATYGVKETIGSDKARVNDEDLYVEGASPSIFDSLVPDFIDINFRTNSALSLGE